MGDNIENKLNLIISGLKFVHNNACFDCYKSAGQTDNPQLCHATRIVIRTSACVHSDALGQWLSYLQVHMGEATVSPYSERKRGWTREKCNQNALSNCAHTRTHKQKNCSNQHPTEVSGKRPKDLRELKDWSLNNGNSRMLYVPTYLLETRWWNNQDC